MSTVSTTKHHIVRGEESDEVILPFVCILFLVLNSFSLKPYQKNNLSLNCRQKDKLKRCTDCLTLRLL
jgi:hypothetical protein